MIFVMFGFAFLTTTFFSGHFSYTFFIPVFFFFHVSIPPPTGLLQVHHSIYGINQTTIPRFALTKGWRLKYQTYNLFYVQVKPANIYTLYKPSTVENPQGDRRSPFSAKYRNVPTPRHRAHYPRPKLVGDALQSTGLRSTDDDDDLR